MPALPPPDPQKPSTARVAQLTVRTDRALVRFGAHSTRYLLAAIIAPEAPRRAERIPVNLALVLDRSGSMAGDKFALARQAVEQALAQLQPDDRFTLVVYDDHVDVLAESTRATSAARRAALERLARVDARGSTDLEGGWMRACEQLALAMSAAAPGTATISRCLLLTDGLANHGLTDPAALIARAAGLRERGIQTSTFGVGEDFDERLLAGMADAGGGHFYFLAEARQIPELIASEVGEALEVVIRHAVLDVHLAPGMTAEPLTRFRSRTVETGDSGSVLRIELGDLVSGQEVEIVAAVRFPRGAEGEVGVEVGLLDADGLPCASAAVLSWTYAAHAANDTQPRDRVVDRRVATLYAERARGEAVEHNRAGRYDRARHVLTATAKRIREYAGTDAELMRIADELLRDVEAHTDAPMPAMEMKARFYQAHNISADRAPSGRARRSGQQE